MSFRRLAVLGLGKVGLLAAELLTDAGFEVLAIDAREIGPSAFKAVVADVSDPSSLGKALKGQEAVLSCLPYCLNNSVASAAHTLGLHYFDLTEDVSGLPLIAIPGIKLEPGRYRPASGLAGAQRRPDRMLAARSSLALVGDSRARSEV